MSKSQRTKGHNYERFIARWFRDCVGIDAKRRIQSRDGNEAPDVETPFFDVECKKQKAPVVRRALEQATKQARKGRYPVAICKWDDQRNADAVVAMRLEDFGELVREWHERGLR